MGRRIPSKAIQHGYNFDNGNFRDDMNVRCSRCGFICNMDRDLRSHPGGYEGWGYNFQTTTVVDGIGTVIPSYSFPIPSIPIQDDSGVFVYDDSGNPIVDDTGSSAFYPAAPIGKALIYDMAQSYDSAAPYDSPTYTDTVTDPVISAGCPQCGTLLYNNPGHCRG